ncbi:uncharacterized protein LOC130649578 [Hydractinia symbiolongicarpus]|uniref:uncharacterized protein LOC130649578 n=1 Tax=Hydractinia symbiolongicarpus TaxID=13093 RepID=UPI00255042D7|nr:uncharacterized protein LOC130649578 [Hydractinia symbiolongicarpus]
MESDHDIVSGDECPSDDSLYSPQLQIHIDDSYDENICEEESFDTAECNPGLKSDAQFLVFWSCLLTLFQVCFTCLQKTCITRVVKRGTLIIVTSICPNKHVFSWQSQPIVNGRAAGNLLLSAAILYSGNTYARIAEMMSILRLQFISKSTFYDIQRSVLFPKLNTFYKKYRNNIYSECAAKEGNLIGDGRSDSPGYSAKYGTYTLMSVDINKIIDFQVVHVRTAGNSSRMEKWGLVTLLNKLRDHKVTVSALTTDRHVQIRAFMKKEHPEINHQFDVWHFGKSLKKSLTAAAKRKECLELIPWIKSIINHLWWCCASCDKNENVLRERWLSILYHIRGIHSWQGNEYFHECAHPTLDQQRKWLKLNSPAYEAVETIVQNKKTLADMNYLAHFCHTGSLEVFHSLLTKYCSKRIHFSMEGMVARTQLAVLDFNSGTNCEQAVTKKGVLRYKQVFSRVTQSWVVKKITEKKEKAYLAELMTANLEPIDNEKDKLPQTGEIAERITEVEKPDKSDAIKATRTRFKT